MNSSTKVIRIKLEAPTDSAEYYKSLQQWENEGGRPDSLKDTFPFLNFPFHPGETFHVQNVHINMENDEFYYVAEIKNVTDK